MRNITFNNTVLFVKIIISIVFIIYIIYSQQYNKSQNILDNKQQKNRRRFLIAIMAISIFTFFNFGQFRGGHFIHQSEMFHYYMGTKYFKELGYFDLYNATVVADSEDQNKLGNEKKLIDLKTYELIPISYVLANAGEYKSQFSPKRWKAFKRDLRYFLRQFHQGYYKRLLQDHGYNASPSWTFFVRIITNIVPVNQIFLLTLFDILLLALMFVAVYRTFGLEVMAGSVVFFCVNFLNDYGFIVGSLLRYDWLVCIIIGICAMEKSRFRLAGALFAFSSMVRIFPVIFLFGLAVKSLVYFAKEKKLPQGPQKMLVSFTIASCLFLGLTLFLPKPAENWKTFLVNMKLHSKNVFINQTGFKYISLFDKSYLDANAFAQKYNNAEIGRIKNWQNIKLEEQNKRKIFIFPILFVFVALCSLISIKKDDISTIIWSSFLIFLFLFLSHYYFTFLLVLFLILYSRKEKPMNATYAILLLLVQIVCYLLDYSCDFELAFFFYISLAVFLYYIVLYGIELRGLYLKNSGRNG